jgi:hypothetical protein
MAAPHAIPSDVALRIAKRRAARFGYNLILPDHPAREAVLYGMAAAHELTGSGWNYETAKRSVSVTLPGVGPVADLLRAIPYVGPIFASAATAFRAPTVFPSPAAIEHGLLGTIFHEEGHVGDIRRGGLPWCLCYGFIDEVRVGAEAPCKVCGMIERVHFDGISIAEAETESIESLRPYGLGAEFHTAELIVRGNAATLRRGADPGGIIAEMRAELALENWSPA